MLSSVSKAARVAVVWLFHNGAALTTDCAGIVAVVLISHGAAMLNEAAGYIVGGTLLLVGVIKISAARAKSNNSQSESA